jgi:hypothetical protein
MNPHAERAFPVPFTHGRFTVGILAAVAYASFVILGLTASVAFHDGRSAFGRFLALGVAAYLSAVVGHELGHALALGSSWRRIKIGVNGAWTSQGKGTLSRPRSLVVLGAGCLSNLILACSCAALSLAIPGPFLPMLGAANVLVLLASLVPEDGSDGARLMAALGMRPMDRSFQGHNAFRVVFP